MNNVNPSMLSEGAAQSKWSSETSLPAATQSSKKDSGKCPALDKISEGVASQEGIKPQSLRAHAFKWINSNWLVKNLIALFNKIMDKLFPDDSAKSDVYQGDTTEWVDVKDEFPVDLEVKAKFERLQKETSEEIATKVAFEQAEIKREAERLKLKNKGELDFIRDEMKLWGDWINNPDNYMISPVSGPAKEVLDEAHELLLKIPEDTSDPTDNQMKLVRDIYDKLKNWSIFSKNYG